MQHRQRRISEWEIASEAWTPGRADCVILHRERGKKITHNWLFRTYFLFYFIIILMYCVGLIITRSSSLMYFLVERHRPSVLAEPHSDPFWSLIGTIFNWDSFFFFKEWILYKDVEIVIDKRIKIKTVPFRLSGRNGREITQTPRNSGKIRNVFSNLPQVSRRFGRRRVVQRRHDKALSDSRANTSSSKRSGLPTYIGAKKRAEQFRAVAISPIRAFFAVTIIIKKTIL